ncbi:LAGLIDADG family homing endonuclease [Mycolicibacter heraklionensis]|uniref:Gp37-like protein n=1 Tax=Mycolicibacter heraklionensis TaxID=512402 RepID=UPI000AB7656C|nr:LAGLIDADG family homing endonuclease [Mycolicibacter heraklionensis]
MRLPRIGENGVPNPLTAPISAYRYADAKRKVKDAESRARPLIRLWDKNMDFIGRIGGEKSVDVEQRLHDTGTGSIVLRGSDWINKFLRTDVRANDDLNITIDPYPNNRNWRWRWGGKVTAVRNVRTEKGLHELHFDVAENREHWKHLYFAATPWFAPEFQPLKAWVLPGNTRTIVSVTGFVNLARIFYPPLGIIDNFVNPGAWIKPLTDGRLWSPLNWPIQMQFVNPLTDTSRFSVIATRWSPAHDTTAGLLKDAGCNLRAYTWLTEDEDSPHPELAALIGQEAARPTRNCFSGSERFLTRYGTKTFAETAGTEQMVLGHRGEWTPAVVEAFGQQELYRMVVARHGIEKEILTTAGHRWFRSGRRRMRGDKWSTETTTLGLRPGDRLASKFKTSHLHRAHLSAVGIQAGLVFGDGHKNASGGSTVRLFGEKDAQLLKWFPLAPTTSHTLKTGVPYTEVSALPGYFKDAPPLNESHSYLYGWLAGYFAADGCVAQGGESRISTASLEHARLVQDVCHVLGIKTGSIRSVTRRGLGDAETALYSVGLRTRDLDEDFFLIGEHRIRAAARIARDDKGHGDLADWTVVSVEPTGEVEQVYCAVVEDGQAFTLDGNIFTGNCIVLAVEDQSGVVGLTGTAVDGAINLVAATADDLISELLYSFVDADAIDPRTNSPVPPYVRDMLGIAPRLPSIVFRDSTAQSPIKSSERAIFKSTAKSVIVGGKSPGWVNQLQTFGIKYGLSWLQVTQAGVYSFGAGGATGPAPIGSGLEEVYQGQFDNMLLAFMRHTDPLREIQAGDMGYLEYFTQEGGGTAYTISSALTQRQGLWKTRPYQSFKVSIWNRRPYSVYYDFDLGTRALFEIDGLLYTDQFTAIRMHYDEDTPKTFEVTIGTGSDMEDPMAQAVRTIQTMWSAVGTLFGSNDLF